MDHPDSRGFEFNWLSSANFHGYDCDDALWESRSGLNCASTVGRRVCSQQQSRLGWMMSGLKKLFRRVIHGVFMRAAVWAVNDVRFYYCIWNVPRLTCMLKHLLIRQAGLRHPSLPACCVNIGPPCKKHKHISALINAIKWSSASWAWLHRSQTQWMKGL